MNRMQKEKDCDNYEYFQGDSGGPLVSVGTYGTYTLQGIVHTSYSLFLPIKKFTQMV